MDESAAHLLLRIEAKALAHDFANPATRRLWRERLRRAEAIVAARAKRLQSGQPDPASLSEDDRDAYEERCAIIQEGCKVTRAESERLAMDLVCGKPANAEHGASESGLVKGKRNAR